MSRGARCLGVVAALLCLGAAAARAQSTTNEWWNELDLYWTAPSEQWRLFGLAQEARGIETTDRRLTLGLHVDDLKIPWGFARVGFRTIRSINGSSAPEDRALAEVTVPATKGRLRFRNRTRLELRWIGGEPSQRWRDRVQLESHYDLPHQRELVPYATVRGLLGLAIPRPVAHSLSSWLDDHHRPALGVRHLSACTAGQSLRFAAARRRALVAIRNLILTQKKASAPTARARPLGSSVRTGATVRRCSRCPCLTSTVAARADSSLGRQASRCVAMAFVEPYPVGFTIRL